MARPDANDDLPPCYAQVVPGLEAVAAEEISQSLGAEVKRTAQGLVVFRAPVLDRSLLSLRTTEDVFLLAWGTDQLSYRAADLQSIRRWTERFAGWSRLLQLHHSIRPKPKSKPTLRLVVQMHGEHGYRRVDARKALLQGLAGKVPASWRHVEENAAVEIWLTIQGRTAVCGIRLSDRTMRHRSYKQAHQPASLRPTVAAAMAHLAGVKPGHVVLDPMCGAGTILAEVQRGQLARRVDGRQCGTTSPRETWLLGGDMDRASLRAAAANLRSTQPADLACWDARRLPLPDSFADRLLSNLPFGKQLSRPDLIGPLYRELVPQFQRVLKTGGRAVLLAADVHALQEAVQPVPWKIQRRVSVRILGQKATIFVFVQK